MTTHGTDPLATLDRTALAVLAREYILCGHLIDRAAMGYLIGPFGRDGMAAIAIDEWMGASPVYTQRMQELLGFTGDDVATIFKGMQFDIGAPHEFLDFRFEVEGPDSGRFWLDHCGALMDVEPMGEDFVLAMCHDIEDPTFDATAAATNPRAQVRPVHRPPRMPADRVPHCEWKVRIVEDAEPIEEAEVTLRMRSTRAAAVPLTVVEPAAEGSGGGADDYSGEFVDRIAFEEFSAGALRAIIDELCLQQHLLAMSFMAAVGDRAGSGVALEMGDHQLTGIAGVTSERFVGALGLGPDTASMATVLRLHPLLRPGSYVDAEVTTVGDEVTINLRDCEALREEAGRSWVGLLVAGRTRPLDAIIRAVDPRARCEPVAAADGAVATWRIVVDDEPTREQPEVGVTRLSTGAAFAFEAPSEVSVTLR